MPVSHPVVYDYFCAMASELSNCDRDHMVLKDKNIYRLACYKYVLPIPILEY